MVGTGLRSIGSAMIGTIPELTVVWVTHDVPQAKRVAERIANLKGGRVRQVSDAEKFIWEGAY